MTYTLAQLRALLAVRWEAVPFWSDDEARRALNTTFRTWNLLVGRWRVRLPPVVTVANQVYYTTPAGGLAPIRVHWQGAPLDQTSIHELDFGRPAWETETTASGGDVPSQPLFWARVGWTTYAIWPACAAANLTLTLDAVQPAPVLTTDASTIDLNDGERGLLLDYALHTAAFKAAGEIFAATAPHAQRFYQAALQANARLRASGAFRVFAGLDQQPRLRPLAAARPADQTLTLGGGGGA